MNLGEFYSANSHVNEITGCVIWDGEYTKGIPYIPGVGIQVRKVIYDSLNGPQPHRTRYIPKCENPNCVKAEHIEATRKAVEFNYPSEKVAEAWKLYTEQGLRQAKIAEMLGVTESTVSKWLKAAKQIKDELGAVEQGG